MVEQEQSEPKYWCCICGVILERNENYCNECLKILEEYQGGKER